MRSETEWSAYVNPWSRRIELVVARHRIVDAPVGGLFPITSLVVMHLMYYTISNNILVGVVNRISNFLFKKLVVSDANVLSSPRKGTSTSHSLLPAPFVRVFEEELRGIMARVSKKIFSL